MSVYQAPSDLKHRFRPVLSSFLQQAGLPFSSLLSEARIEQVLREADCSFARTEDDAVYTPAITLWAFLSQVLFQGEQRSCLAAVSRIAVFLVALGEKPCAKNSGAYCRARARIPTRAIRQLTSEAAIAAEQSLPKKFLWLGREVFMTDGFTFSMPDTVGNQAEYPQAATQKPGLGFPLARCVALFSLATAMVLDLEIGPYSGKETGEPALLRKLLHWLKSGEILLGDCCFCSYFMIALLQELKVDCVFRMHQCRSTDLSRSRRSGKKDHVARWDRPPKPTWMDDETYARMPKSLEVREVAVQIDKPGFRPESLVVITTLLDADTYTADDIRDLFRRRWLVEQDIRALKSNLGIDVLRCQTPEMVRKELRVAILAYNLIRQAMLQAALQGDLAPRDLSFTHALQAIASSWMLMPVLNPAGQAAQIAAALHGLCQQRVGRRPDRVEPRAIKRRPKPHDLLSKPRCQARAELINGTKT